MEANEDAVEDAVQPEVIAPDYNYASNEQVLELKAEGTIDPNADTQPEIETVIPEA